MSAPGSKLLGRTGRDSSDSSADPVVTDRQKRWLTVLLVTGVALRLIEYAANRGLWLDEISLKRNLVQGSLWNPWGALSDSQVAPPLYLLVERWLAWISGGAVPALRLVSLLASCAALWLIWEVGRRLMPGRAALAALALLAFSDEQIYFASELKPYGLDLTVGLGLTLAALRIREAGYSRRALLSLAALGAVSVWASFPSVFVLAGIGTWMILGAIREHSWRRAFALAAVGLAWLLSFALALHAARSQIGGKNDLWEFWQSAFPPSLTSDPLWIPRRLLFLFVSPLDYHGLSPLDQHEWIEPRLMALPAILCALLGLIRLARQRPGWLGLLLGPVAFALVAAAAHRYPFHGRLIMFVVPTLLLFMASGVEAVWSRLGRWPAWGLLLILLAPLLISDAYHLIEPRVRSGLSPLGDRRPYWLMPDLFQTGPVRLPPMTPNRPSGPY